MLMIVLDDNDAATNYIMPTQQGVEKSCEICYAYSIALFTSLDY